MSKPPTTPYHLLRRGTSSPSNVSSAFTTLAHRGAAVVASAGIGMGLGTAAATASPWSVAHLAGVPVGAVPVLVKTRSPSPPVPVLGRNRTSVARQTTPCIGPVPLRRLTTSAKRTTPLAPVSQHATVPPYRLTGHLVADNDFVPGYDQHRTGIHLPSVDDTSFPRKAFNAGPLDRPSPPRHRVWDLRNGWDSSVKGVNGDGETGIAGHDTFPVSPPATLSRHATTSAYARDANASASTINNAQSGKPTTASPSSSSPSQEPSYILNASASGIPKQRHQTPSPRTPTPSDPLTHTTAVQVGEDAYYLRPESLGISDGVGGWSSARRKRQQRRVVRFDGDEGGRKEVWVEGEGDADPGRFSRLLMHFCERQVEDWRRERGKKGGEGKVLDPVEIMQKGYEKCIDTVQTEGIFGSATCLVAVLTDNQLRIANLGDCAIVVVRNGEIIFRTEEMQHSFNFPLQLGTNSRDEPMKDAEYHEVQVKKGDIIVMCSDGLSDNLFDEDILEIIASHTTTPTPTPHALSEALCKAAQDASEETGSASPFMCRAIEEGLDFMGGKKDDISVLVAVVTDRDELEGR